MSYTKQLQDLKILTDMVFSARSAEAQAILARYAELRTQLEQLAVQESVAQDRFSEDIHLRLSRTDVLWQTWLGQQKKALNMELARVTVEKEQQMQAVRLAFGRKEVAAQLARQTS